MTGVGTWNHKIILIGANFFVYWRGSLVVGSAWLLFVLA